MLQEDRAKQAAAAGGFGALLAVVTGATAIGIGIVAALGAGLAWALYRNGE
ncbi:MAG: hypothetical protein ACM3S1_01275 [Hyphomicrobiales bacterium]